MVDQRPTARTGWFVALIGVALGAMVYLRPEGREAPGWVVYAACGAFLFAGLSIVAASAKDSKLQAWLAIACMAAMGLPALWIAFWPGPRACSVSLPFVSTAARGMVCRTAFGFGAVMVAAIIVWAVVRAIRPAAPAE